MPALLLPDAEIAAPINCIISDVDGVMTDGRIIYTNDGGETKRFHARDGLGIKLWMRSGFQFGILTARESEAVQRRGNELGIQLVRQGCGDKLLVLRDMLETFQCDTNQVCYIGDDLPDLAVMKSVRLAAAPADAAVDVREASHWILRSGGGHGAVRELVERLLRAKQRWEEHLTH